MRFTAPAGVLRDALTRARQLVPSTPSLVAYSGILVRVDPSAAPTGAALQLVSSDGDSTMIVDVPVEDPVAGSVLVAPRPVLSLLGSLPASSPVTVAVTSSGDVEFTGDGFNPYSFRPLAATFPLPPTPAPGVRPAMLATLAPGLAAVRPAVARDSSAVQLVSDGDQLVLHTTDGYRLARVVLPGAGFGTFTGVLPFPVLERVARTSPVEVTVDLRGRSVAFRSRDALVVSRLLATPFPAVDSVLGNAPVPVTSLDAAAFELALTRIASVAEQGSIGLEFTGTELHLRASTAEVGAGHETLALRTAVPSTFQVQLRVQFLRDAVAALAGGSVSIAYSGALQPVFFSTGDPFPVTHVVMPVRA